MKRHEEVSAFVVPIILRNCKWTDMPYAKLQALSRNAQPVSEFADRDSAFTFIATEIERLVDYILSERITLRKTHL